VGKLDGTTSNIWLLTILLVTTGLLAPKSSCAWVLELKPEATLEGPAVHIRDICASEIPEDLGAIVLRDGMQPGQIYSISGRNILRRLVSLRKARNISLKGADGGPDGRTQDLSADRSAHGTGHLAGSRQ
jgi:hypothetical protein